MDINMRLFPVFAGLALMAAPVVADVPKVVADIAPVHALVATVMEGLGEPVLILKPNVSPHEYALRPSQARALQGAGLVVWIGHELTPWLEKPIESLATGAVKLELLDAEETQVLPARMDGQEDEHDHDHGHDHDGADPHAWLDPQNARIWLGLIAGELARIDPEHADDYRANAVRAQAGIDLLMTDISVILHPVKDQPFVTLHDAYQYFEARFGLRSVGSVTLSDASDASPARVVALRDRLAAEGVHCAFQEPGTNAGVLQGLAAGGDLTVTTLDPMGRDLPIGAGLYAGVLQAMAQAFVVCVGTEK